MHALVDSPPLWKIEHVSLGSGRLREVTLDIHAGITAVLGWSGAGKTSLLNLLAGFEHPDSGRMVASATSIGWVPQNGGLWSASSARDHLEIAAGFERDATPLLDAFDLLSRADALPGDLSEGEQSRLSVARALAMQAPVLIMDEPLVHVDPARAGRYWGVIRETLARTGASLVFATHEPQTAIGEAERVICLKDGALLHEGPVADLYFNPPTPELMNFLGPGNWFTPEDARLWLGLAGRDLRCVRPERLGLRRSGATAQGPGGRGQRAEEALLWEVGIGGRSPEFSAQKAEAGGLEVVSARFYGAVESVQLRDIASGTLREFFHRPPGPELLTGMRVTLELLA